MRVEPSVFKSYDIRGTYPHQLDELFAYVLGRALPRVFPTRRVAVGHDGRLSSPALYGALLAGLRDGGVRTAGLGLCPTELVYYAAGGEFGFDLGVMITASHNPPEYNGFKVVRAGGEPVSGTVGLDQVRLCMEGMDPPEQAPAAAPDESAALMDDYLDFALDLVGRPCVEGLRLAVDAGNGVAGLLWDALAGRLGLEPLRVNWEPDGRFPAHHPDPSRRENLDALVCEVTKAGAGLGFAYDGDADRVMVVLADGHVVDGSEMISCIVERMLSADPGLVFAVGQTTSRKALDRFRELGVAPVLSPVGHAKIKALMRATPQIAFAGEDAGHYYYRDFFCCDSSLITTLHVLHLASGGGLARMVGALPGPWQRPRREPTFAFDRQDRALAVCRQVALAMLEGGPDPLEITCETGGRILRRCAPADVRQADGVRVDYADWWFCVRPSGTEPVARLALEARSADLMTHQKNVLSGMFRRLA